MTSPTQARGFDAESIALNHLSARGLTLLARQWRCRFGEVDLIMRDGAVLVFVEVKQRTSEAFGGALASITASKLAKLERAAQLYLSESGHRGACRFDAALVDRSRNVEWLRNITN